MKIVIDITKEDYDWIMQQDTMNEVVYRGWKEIQNGQVLPNGHGDLIDRKALEETFDHLSSDDYESPLWYEDTVFRVINNAPTIIKVDKETANG